LINLHFSLGIAIRNAFGLHNADSKLLASSDIATHPDDVSGVIIKAFWDKLTGAGNRGVAIFAKDFSGHPARKNQQKCTRPLMPSAAPIRPRHLVSTQQGVET
jgi:hypothetical protein